MLEALAAMVSISGVALAPGIVALTAYDKSAAWPKD